MPCDRSIALGALTSSSHLLECVLTVSRARPHPFFTLDVDPAGSWHVQLFRLLFDSDVAMKTFRPVALVQAVSDVVAFWTPGDPMQPRRQKKLEIKPLSLGVSQLPLLDIVSDEEGGPRGVHVAAANAIAAGDPDVGGHAGDAVSSSDEDVRRGADGIGGVLDDSDAAGDAWEVSSSDEDEADGGAHLLFHAARHLFISSKTNTRDGGSNQFEEKH